MCKLGRVPTERLVERDVNGRADNPVLTAHHVRHAHKVIVYNNRKVIGREAVAFNHHRVAQLAVRHAHHAAQFVNEARLAINGGSEAQDKRFTIGGAFFRLLFGKLPSVSVIATFDLSDLLQLLRRLKGSVECALL